MAPFLIVCRNVEAVRRKERSEAHLYLTVEVFTNDDIQLNHGAELLDLEEMKGRYAYIYIYVHVCVTVYQCVCISYMYMYMYICVIMCVFYIFVNIIVKWDIFPVQCNVHVHVYVNCVLFFFSPS